MPEQQTNDPPKRYGATTTVDIDTETGHTESLREEIFAGSTTRRIIIEEDSIKIDDEKTFVTAALQLYQDIKSGKALGGSVDATKYDPRTLQINRIIVSTMKFADK